MTTGKAPSDTVVEEKWAPSYLYGLVPARIDVSEECPNGIASAQRDFPFVNMLVNTLTIGIYLPQHVTVTCAAEDPMSAELSGPASLHNARSANVPGQSPIVASPSARSPVPIVENPVQARDSEE